MIASIARLLCRELTLQNEHLRLENKVLKSKVKGRIRFDDKGTTFPCGRGPGVASNVAEAR